MKKLPLLFLFFTLICNAQNSKQNIVGEWIATDFDAVEGTIIFTEDFFVSMTIGAEFVDGKNYIVKGGINDGQKGLLKYEIDATSFPIKIDIIAYQIENDIRSEKGRFLGIIEFLNQDEMLMNISFSGVREIEFSESNEVETGKLRRVK